MKQCIRSARCHTVERLSHTFFTGQLHLLEAISGASSQLKRSSLTTRFDVLSGQRKEVAVARFQSAQSEGAAKKLQVHRRGLGAETNGSNLGALQSLGPESPCGDERLNSLERRQVRARLQETTFGGNARRGSTTEGVRTVRPTGGKDRHSKVSTAKGLRDRRVRLSAPTAMQFFDVQDRLGFDQPSKAVDWLIKKAKPAIDELEPLAGPGAERAQKGASSKIAVVPGLNKAETNAIPSTMGGGKEDQAAAVEKPGRSVDQKSRSGGESAEQQQGEGGGEATTEAGVEGNKGDSAMGGGRAESRAKARVRARERAKEKSSTSKAMASSNTSSSFLHQLQAAQSSSTIAGAAAAAMQTKMHSSHPFGSMEANDPPPFGSSPPHPNARHHHLPHTLTFLQQTAPDHPQAPPPSIPTHHHLPRLSDLMFLSHHHPQDFPHLELPFPALLERQMMQQQQSALGPDPSPLPPSHAHTAKLELSNSNATGSSSLRLGSTYQFAASPSSLDLLHSSLHSAQLAMFPGAPHLGVMHPPSSTNGNLQAVNPMGPANVHPGSGSLLFPQPIFLNPAAGASQCSFSPSDQHPHREQDLPRELSLPERDVPSSHISSTNNILVNSQAGPGPPLQSSLISTRGTLQSIFSLTSSQPLQPSACQNIAHDYESGFHVMSPGRSMGTSIENSVSRYPARIQGFDEAAEEETRLPSSSLSY